MTKCILASIFRCGVTSLHFAVYLLLSTPLWNLSSKFSVCDGAFEIPYSPEGEFDINLPFNLLISAPLCNFSSEFYLAYDVVHFIFHILMRGNSASLCRLSALYAISLPILPPTFTAHMTWCIWPSIFARGPIRRHFALYLLISMPLCNLFSKYYCAYDMVHFIFHIWRRRNSASLCRLSFNLYAAFQFPCQIFPRVRHGAF